MPEMRRIEEPPPEGKSSWYAHSYPIAQLISRVMDRSAVQLHRLDVITTVMAWPPIRLWVHCTGFGADVRANAARGSESRALCRFCCVARGCQDVAEIGLGWCLQTVCCQGPAEDKATWEAAISVMCVPECSTLAFERSLEVGSNWRVLTEVND